jgi:hypothetical protein
VGDEVGVEVPPLTAKKVVSVPQDDSSSDGEGSDDLGSNDGKGSNNDYDDGEGSGNHDGKDKAMCIPFRTTPSRIM